MLIKVGEKVHIMMRRAFESQVRRHFAGEVIAAAGSIVRVTGYVFIYDDRSAQYVRKNSKRTTIIDLASAGYIVNIMPDNIDLESVSYETIGRKELFFTDGKGFQLNVNEFGVSR